MDRKDHKRMINIIFTFCFLVITIVVVILWEMELWSHPEMTTRLFILTYPDKAVVYALTFIYSIGMTKKFITLIKK